MAMHDDSGLQLLERDLRKLAEPRESDKQFQRGLRQQLIAPHRPRRLPRLSPGLALGSAALAPAAAIALMAFVDTGDSNGPAVADAAIIHHAITAVTAPANRILHVKVEPGRVSRSLRMEDDLSSGEETLRGCHDLGSTQMS